MNVSVTEVDKQVSFDTPDFGAKIKILVLLIHSLWFLHLLPPLVVSILKHVTVSRMKWPQVTFSFTRRMGWISRSFDEAVIQAQIMSDAVLPSFVFFLEVGKPAGYVLIYRSKWKLLFFRFFDRHYNQCNIRIWRFLMWWFLSTWTTELRIWTTFHSLLSFFLSLPSDLFSTFPTFLLIALRRILRWIQSELWWWSPLLLANLNLKVWGKVNDRQMRILLITVISLSFSIITMISFSLSLSLDHHICSLPSTL